jgi:hypothetical protein
MRVDTTGTPAATASDTAFAPPSSVLVSTSRSLSASRCSAASLGTSPSHR